MEKICHYTASLIPSSWFYFGREDGFPARYSDQFSPAHVDVLTSGLILAFVIITLCVYLTIPGLHHRQRRCMFIYITVSLVIGGIVIVGNFGHEWEVSTVKIKSPYRAGTAEEVKATLGLHIALRGINITLKADPKDLRKLHDLKNETIDYNEHFSWQWEQGRFGFGPYAGRIAREFREAILRGVPFPILQVAEYFTFDGEGIRFGRHYRLAGWYAHIMMWAAFPTWLLANILICSTINGGALFLFFTGLLQLIAISIWACLRNPTELNIPFDSADDRVNMVMLTTKFGNDYYLVAFNGILCVVLSFVIFVCNETNPDGVCKFFGIDPSTNFDEYYENDEGTKTKPGLSEGGAYSSINTGATLGESLKSQFDRSASPTRSRGGSIIVRRGNVSRQVSRRVRASFRVAKPVAKPRRRKAESESTKYNQKVSSATIREENEMSSLLKVPKREDFFSSESEDNENDYENIENIKVREMP